MELLQIYANLYTEATFFLGILNGGEALPNGLPPGTVGALRECLAKLKKECEKIEAVCSLDDIAMLNYILDTQDVSSQAALQQISWAERVRSLNLRLSSELSHRFFFSLDLSRKKILEKPFADGWQEIASSFPATITDIEEMRKCYVFARYPACVFHSMQVIEHGLIVLGSRIGSKDHKPGWVATTGELKRILKTPFDDRTEWERTHYGFVEQMNGTVEALLTAWRNKIDHASGRLAVLPGEFNPATAEDIMSATRAFMRRLAAEMPPSRYGV